MDRVVHLEELDILNGFKFYNAYETTAYEYSEGGTERTITGYATVIEFRNDSQVGINLTILNNELSVGEPYAVDVNMEPLSEYKKI